MWPFAASEEDRFGTDLFNITILRKSLERQSNKARARARAYRDKARASLARGEMDRAQVFASQSVTFTQQSLRALKLSCRAEVAQEIAKSAVSARTATAGVASLLGSVANAAGAMESLDRLESLFDDLQIVTKMNDAAMDAPHEDEAGAAQLLAQLSDELALEQDAEFPDIARRAAEMAIFDLPIIWKTA